MWEGGWCWLGVYGLERGRERKGGLCEYWCESNGNDCDKYCCMGCDSPKSLYLSRCDIIGSDIFTVYVAMWA